MTFQEKSVWISTLAVLAVAVWYLPLAWAVATADEAVPALALVGPTGVAVAMLVAIQIVGHVLAALSGRVDPADERERLIALRGARWSGVLMGIGVFGVIAWLMSEVFTEALPQGPAVTATLLMLILFVSEVAEGLVTLIAYRRAS